MRLSRTKAYFIASLCLASFGYGVASAHYRVFPFAIFQNASRAWRALAGAKQPSDLAYDPSDQDVDDVRGLTEPTVRCHSAAAGDELILVSGGENYLPDHSPEHGCLAWIMDRRGRVMHVWHYNPAVWGRLEKVASFPGKPAEIIPIGLHLYPNGELLVSFHGIDTFPFSIGLARFDKDSKLLWKTESFNHHWFTVASDGRIFCPALKLVDSPCPVGDTRFSLFSLDGKVLRDTVQVRDSNGRLLDEIDVLEALIESGWAGLLPTQTASAPGTTNHERFVVTSNDPTHLNCIRLVDSSTASAHPWLNEGDLLLSMRNLNAVGILDLHTRRFKWMSAGAVVGQHSPRFYDDGVLVLDNRGGAATTGGSRLVQIDLETRTPQAIFPRSSSPLPGEFYTSWAGHLELGDSDRALVAVFLSQKIWEIDLKTGQVLWEYLCVDQHQHRRRLLASAHYVGHVNFPFNRQGERQP
jgi:hypothetical protein